MVIYDLSEEEVNGVQFVWWYVEKVWVVEVSVVVSHFCRLYSVLDFV